MYPQSARRLARVWVGAVVTALTIVAFASPVAAAATPSQPLRLVSIGFGSFQVDATPGSVVVPLTWTVRNLDQSAERLSGVVTLRQRGSAPGTFVGQTYQLSYELNERYFTRAEFVSGNAQNSTYRYYFTVPRYAAGTQARWSVVGVTMSDGQRPAVTLEESALRRHRPNLIANTLVDSTPPTIDRLELQTHQWNATSGYAYVKDQSHYLNYATTVHDGGTGFWKGSVSLTGPGGQTATGEFEAIHFGLDNPSCGSRSGGDIHDFSCSVSVLLPSNAQTGTWHVTDVVLTDNAGNEGAVSEFSALPVVVTSNDVVSASNFSTDPDPVNNWVTDGWLKLLMNVHGAQNGVATIEATFDWPRCDQISTIPTIEPDGRLSTPVRMNRNSRDCVVTGLIITDGAGNVALYGSAHNAPSPDLVVRRLPNTSPPTATGFHVTPDTVAQSELFSAWLVVTMSVTAPIAPVNGYDLYYLDSAGSVNPLSTGGVSVGPENVLTLYASLPYFIEPGSYTLGIRLSDASGLVSSYGLPGWPDNHDLPEGALRFTVTAD